VPPEVGLAAGARRGGGGCKAGAADAGDAARRPVVRLVWQYILRAQHPAQQQAAQAALAASYEAASC